MFESVCPETLKSSCSDLPGKLPAIISHLSCVGVMHEADQGEGRAALAEYVVHLTASVCFCCAAFACLLSSLEAMLPTVSLRERWREWGDLTGFIMVRSQLTGKLWQLKATQARTHGHTHTCTVWLHFSLWIRLVVVCRWRLCPHYSLKDSIMICCVRTKNRFKIFAQANSLGTQRFLCRAQHKSKFKRKTSRQNKKELVQQ